MNANLKKARAAYVSTMVDLIVTKQFLNALAKQANEWMNDEAVSEVLYGKGKRVSRSTAKSVVQDVAYCEMSESDFGAEISQLMFDAEQMVRDEIVRRVTRNLRVKGERVVKVEKNGREYNVVK